MSNMPCTTKTEEEIIKKINVEQEFANRFYKDMISKRYGLTSCCPLDKLQTLEIKKEVCDWDDEKIPVETKAYKDQTTDPTYKWNFGDSPEPSWLIAGCGQFNEKCTQDGVDLDNECISIYVKDDLGNAVSCYTIYVDGKDVGVTDSNGFFKYQFTNGSAVTKHVLDLCHCFVTTGLCSQQRIDITVTPEKTKEICTTNTQCA